MILVVMDYSDCTIKLHKSDVKIDEEDAEKIMEEMGINPSNCEWMVIPTTELKIEVF